MKPVDLSTADLLHREAVNRHRAGDLAGAADVLRRLLPLREDDVHVLRLLGVAEVQLGEVEQGRKRLERALELSPGLPELHHDVANAHRIDGDFDEALQVLEFGLRVHPDSALLTGARAYTLQQMGRAEEAFTLASAAIDRGDRHPTLDMVFAMLCARHARHQEGVNLLNRRIADPRLSPVGRAEAHYILGNLLDELGRYDEAFAAYRAANALRPASFDAEEHARLVDRLIDAWTPEAFRGLPRPDVDASQAVLILGMPRSGTTLVEQVLASHPEVVGGGELPDVGRLVLGFMRPHEPQTPYLCDLRAIARPGALAAAAGAYLGALRSLGPDARRVTDKAPLNFVHLGFIAAMLPGVRIIHCVRNPLDTCLSCYFQTFAGNYAFTNDPTNLGLYFRDYRRLMDHWKQTLEVQMIDVQYEALVYDQESESRRIVAFAGLAWNDRCLRPHESKRIANTASNDQVRRPVYRSSVGRHKHYEKHLEPLRMALGM